MKIGECLRITEQDIEQTVDGITYIGCVRADDFIEMIDRKVFEVALVPHSMVKNNKIDDSIAVIHYMYKYCRVNNVVIY